MFWNNFKKPHLIAAHRGNSFFYPENTLIAFENAKNCDFIEFDIQLTKDNKIVIIHDDTSQRTSDFNTSKQISELTLKELKEFSFGNWFLKHKKIKDKKIIEKIKSQKIPTLEEALKIIKKPINIEIKSSQMDLEQLLYLTKNKIQKILFSSFHHYHLKNLKKLNQNCTTALLDENYRENIIEYLKEFETDNYNISKNMAKKEYLKYLIQNNINISVYTLTNREKIKKLFMLGVKAVFKNKC